MIASRILRVVIADKEGCFVLIPDGIYGEKAREAIKKLNREAVKASRNLCGLSENYRHHDSLRGLRVFIADKEGCFVVMPDGIYGETAREAIKNC